jgi:hypothetical protein
MGAPAPLFDAASSVLACGGAACYVNPVSGFMFGCGGAPCGAVLGAAVYAVDGRAPDTRHLTRVHGIACTGCVCGCGGVCTGPRSAMP